MKGILKMEKIKLFENAIKNNLFTCSSQDPAAINFGLASAYMETVKTKNQQLNFSGPIFEHDVAELADQMDDAGIHTFTISCTSSGLLNVLALFEQHYWFVQGMTEVLANYNNFETGNPEVIPALIVHKKY